MSPATEGEGPRARFEVISLRRAADRLKGPFQLHPLTDLNEYTCYLYRCEGAVPLHRHLDHDEVLWPQDHPINLLGEAGGLRVAAGTVAWVPRGWQHGSAAESAAHVLLVSRAARVHTLNGHPARLSIDPPALISPAARLEGTAANEPQWLLRCDTLVWYAEQVAGTGPSRRATHDVLVVPLRGSVGVRCGGIVAVLRELELARLPAGCGWHLFGGTPVVWMTPHGLEGTA